MDAETVQTVAKASDDLIPIIAAFFVAFTGLIKLWSEIYKIKRDRLKTKAERDQRFEALEKNQAARGDDVDTN